MASTPAPESIFLSIPSPHSSRSPIELHALVDRGSSNSKEKNPTVISLHYWGGSAATYHHIPALLRSRDSDASRASSVTLVSLSHRGWGSSGRAEPDESSAYSITALASDVVAVLPQLVTSGLVSLEQGFVLCGHSMGAKVAVAVAASLYRLKAETSGNGKPSLPPLRGLLLLAPAPPGPLVLPEEIRRQQATAYDSVEGVQWTVREVLTAAKGNWLNGGTADFEMVVRDSLAGSEGAKRGWPEVGMAEDVDIQPLWDSHLKVRVLVASGDRVETADRVEKAAVEVLKRNGLDITRFRIIEPDEVDCGHLLPLEAPGIVTEELVELLKDVKNI